MSCLLNILKKTLEVILITLITQGVIKQQAQSCLY